MEPAVTTMAGVSDYISHLLSPENLMAFSGRLISVLVVLIIMRVLLKFSEVAIDRIITGNERLARAAEGRAKTIGTLIKSIARYIIYFIGGVTILQQLGISVTSLLTAAGIGGLAVGFGAQSLVKDIITGFFILFEEQYNVGDYVEIAGKSGIVEEMGIRTTKIRDFGGQLHIIPNGSIGQVTNYMGPKMRVQFDVSVSYNTDLDQAIKVIQQAMLEVANEHKELFVEKPVVLGIEELADSSVNIRVKAQTPPMQQWLASRMLRKRIKEALDAAGIEIPFPHCSVILRNEESKTERE